MTTGMLWFDNSTSPLSIKIKKAMDYYQKKYGRMPDMVLVHPSALGDGLEGSRFSSDGLTIRAYRPVLPGHLWLGVEDKS